MREETKVCQNCKASFLIDVSDFAFYEKIQVPPPTWCPECRLQRRLMFRNERSLYKRKCDLCGKDMIAVYSPDKAFKVYCNPCWWSDKWDAGEYAMEYDFNKNFFEQFQELQKKVPLMPLNVEYPTMTNSDYTNHAGYLKDCYLVFNTDEAIGCAYLVMGPYSRECMDGIRIHTGELCYENINVEKSYNVHFSEDIESSHNISFSKNLNGCNNCLGCVNLRNKQYFIFNQSYSPEEYKRKIGEYNLGSFQAVEKIYEEAKKFWQTFPHKALHGVHNVNSSGDYIYNAKNTHESYMVNDAENLKFSQLITLKYAKDSYDYTEWGRNAEQIYECITTGQDANGIRMCSLVWNRVFDIDYSMYVFSASHMFGCIGMRKKEYCILNRQYSKEEYEKLREQIIKDMNERPYIDSKGRRFAYGEFFPYDMSFFSYNETTAQDYVPLTKEGVVERGWRWKEKEDTRYQITKRADGLPDHIKDVDDSVTKEIIECSSCGKAYRIIPQELELLRRFGLPLPRKCFECRHRARLARMNPMRFYDRQCAKCKVAIRTSYAPDRPEVIYCEQCFNNEVA